MSEFQVHGTPKAVAALFTALDIARAKATAVRKASESNLGAYASSEHIMVVARKALAETGVSVTPADSALDADKMILERGYVVAHAHGGWYRASMSWPVLGRPDVGKGTGIAETMAFAYFLRTLLMMPRMAGDDMDNKGIQFAMKESHKVKDWRPSIPMQGLVTEAAPEVAPATEYDDAESRKMDAEDAQ